MNQFLTIFNHQKTVNTVKTVIGPTGFFMRADNEYADQIILRMRRLTWVFVGRTYEMFDQ